MLIGPRASRGISLIEVMVSVGIIALLLGFAAPMATTWIQNTQIRTAAESVVTGMQTARVEAMKRNTYVSFQMTSATSTAWTVCLFDPINNVCTAAPALFQKSASEGSTNARIGTDLALSDTSIAIAPGTGVPGQTTFDSFGRLAATAPNNVMRVDVRNPTMTSQERRLVVLITVNGQIRMCDPQLAKATNPQGCA